MDFAFRRLLVGAALLTAVFLPHVASAAPPNCSAGGKLTISLSPCPLNVTVEQGKSIGLSPTAHVSGTVSGSVYVLVGNTGGVIETPISLYDPSPGVWVAEMASNPSLTVGQHKGSMTIKICPDQACNNPYTAVSLPYDFNVLAAPQVTALSPSSQIQGTTSFTLVVTGKGFTPGSKIRFGSSSLAATYVSAAELKANVVLPASTAAQDYSVSVVTANSYVSNPMTFALKNPLPSMTKISPAEASLGTGKLSLTVTGKGFVHGSTIHFGGKAVTTTFVSSTELKAALNFSTKTVGGTYAVTVVSAAPGGGSTKQATFTLNNLSPVITSISPTAMPVGSSTFTLTVNGTGFQPNSVVQLSVTSQQSLATVYVSPTELQLQNVDYQGVGVDAAVSVVNPIPGGGTSNGATLEYDNPVSTLSWIAPTKAYVGSGDLTLTAYGTNFNSSTTLQWNGVALQTVKQTGTLLQATLPAADLVSATTATVTLSTPAPGGASTDQSFPVVVQPPAITSLSPGYTTPGASDFTLTVYGTNFDSNAVVDWNGSALTTSFVSATELQATVPAADVASGGVNSVNVVNPPEAGGTSVPATFAVDSSGTVVSSVAQNVADIEWDPNNFLLYGSATSSAATHPDSIVVVDPVASVINTTVGMPASPYLLSISSGSEFLYVYLSDIGSIERLNLPSLTKDVSITIPSDFEGLQAARALAVSPLYPHMFATILVDPCCEPNWKDGYVFVDGNHSLVASNMVSWGTLAWSPDGKTLYSGDEEVSSDFIAVNLDFDTATSEHDYNAVWSGKVMHLDAGSGLIYADESTKIIDPSSGSATGSFPLVATSIYTSPWVMVPDASLGCLYVLYQTDAQVNTHAWTLSCFDATTHALTRSMVISNVNEPPSKLMRWGNEGLVFATYDDSIYFVSGKFVTGN